MEIIMVILGIALIGLALRLLAAALTFIIGVVIPIFIAIVLIIALIITLGNYIKSFYYNVLKRKEINQ